MDTKQFRQIPIPETLTEGEPAIIQIMGDYYFAGANSLDQILPEVGQTKNPVVILNFRGSTQMGSTLINVLDGYAEDLHNNFGKLYLTGLYPEQIKYLKESNKVKNGMDIEIFERTDTIGETTIQAYDHALTWLEIQA